MFLVWFGSVVFGELVLVLLGLLLRVLLWRVVMRVVPLRVPLLGRIMGKEWTWWGCCWRSSNRRNIVGRESTFATLVVEDAVVDDNVDVDAFHLVAIVWYRIVYMFRIFNLEVSYNLDKLVAMMDCNDLVPPRLLICKIQCL